MPQREAAMRDFRRMLKWIVLAALLMVAGGLYVSSLMTELTVHIVLAVIFGIFLSVVLGAGLFALAFFSDKSGHDQNVTDATRRKDEEG